MAVLFEVVMERLRSALKVRNDRELAGLLGLKPNAFYNRKRTGSIPYEAVVELAEKHGMYVDWILFGLGKPFRDESKQAPPVAAVDQELMTEILEEIELAFLGQEAREARQERADELAQAAVRGGLAAFIYNKVAFVPKSRVRSAMIRSEAESLAFGARLADQAAASIRTSRKGVMP